MENIMLSNLKYVAVAAILSVGFAGTIAAPAEAGPLKKIMKAGAFMAAGPAVAGPLVAGAPIAAAVAAPIAVATAPLAAPVAIVGAKAAAGGFVAGAAARALLRR
jgi:hypothetical protein